MFEGVTKRNIWKKFFRNLSEFTKFRRNYWRNAGRKHQKIYNGIPVLVGSAKYLEELPKKSFTKRNHWGIPEENLGGVYLDHF